MQDWESRECGRVKETQCFFRAGELPWNLALRLSGSFIASLKCGAMQRNLSPDEKNKGDSYDIQYVEVEE